MPSPLFVLAALLLAVCAHAANPVTIPIIKGGMNVHIKKLTKLPKFQGSAAKIISMTPYPLDDDLIVVTLTIIYRVKPNGDFSVFLDVAKAFKTETGRELNIDNKAHGGVRSIAFHPKFAKNRLCYISAMEDRPGKPQNFDYISDTNDPIAADSVLVEFKVGKSSDVPIVSSYRNVFRVGMPVFDHPIKQIKFKGNLLYIAHGDGSVQSATAGGGQRPDALGKILRINPKKKDGKPYRIPKNNPFKGNPDMPDEVYALGFRNPHHICFSRNGTLFVADAGRDNIEEVNIVYKAKNYGWSEREGTFVHLQRGGLVTGVKALPSDDAKFGYEYPVVQVGHEGRRGAGFVGQAIAGGCPVENGSPMSGHYYYSDFPETGNLYFSTLSEMFKATTRGKPNKLTQARVRQAVIFFDHDDNPSTAPKKFDNLGDVLRSEPEYRNQERVDVRIGQGKQGELYWSSKRNGKVYVITSSLPGGPGGPP